MTVYIIEQDRQGTFAFYYVFKNCTFIAVIYKLLLCALVQLQTVQFIPSV